METALESYASMIGTRVIREYSWDGTNLHAAYANTAKLDVGSLSQLSASPSPSACDLDWGNENERREYSAVYILYSVTPIPINHC